MKFLSRLFGKSDKEKYQETYELAQKAGVLFEKGEYDKALKFYIQAVRLCPDLEMLHYNIALIHQKKGNYKKAISGFKQSLKLGSKNTDIYRPLGNCYMELENYLMAINNFKIYIRNNPNDALTLCHLGVCYHNIKNWEQSDKYHLDAISKSPSKSYLYRLFGETLSRRPDMDRAFEMFEKAINLVPEDYYSLGKIGDYYAIQKANYEKAVIYYEKIPRLERTPNVHENLSASYFQLDDKEKCLDEIKYSTEHYPDNVDLFYRYYRAKCEFKQKENLIEEIELFLRRNSEVNKLVRALGQLYFEENNLERAFDCAKKLVVREPEDGHNFLLLGGCFLMNGESEEAKIEFSKSRNIFSEGGDINCEAYAIQGLGCCFIIEGDKSEAFSLFQEGLNRTENKDIYIKNLKENIGKLSFAGKEEAILMIQELKK